jgi:hypothetical protein
VRTASTDDLATISVLRLAEQAVGNADASPDSEEDDTVREKLSIILHQQRDDGIGGLLVSLQTALLLAGFSATSAGSPKATITRCFSVAIDQLPDIVSVRVGTLKASMWLWLEDVITLLLVKGRDIPFTTAHVVHDLLRSIDRYSSVEQWEEDDDREAEEVDRASAVVHQRPKKSSRIPIVRLLFATAS